MDDDPIDALQSMPADQGGDEARQEANAAPLATEAPADASARVYQQGTQQRLYGRVRAADLASRGIPSFTTPTGDVKPIVDDTGAAITSADPRNHVGYDSTGNAVSYAKTDDTGKPVLTDPYADAPTVTDKQGNQYSAPKGLGWKWTGTDDDVAAKYEADQQEKIDQATAGAIAPYEQQARSQASQAARAVKQSAKSTAATLAASGVPLTDETGQQAIDLSNVDGPTLKAHINDAFNKEYAAPQANASPMFGGGQFTPQAQAIRQDIDNRKATANAAADAHIDTLSDAQTAQANADALTAQRQQLQASKLDYVNQKRAAMGLAPISIPGVAAKTAQADQSFQTPQESALPGIDTDGKPMPDSAIPGVPKSQTDQPNQSPTFYDRVKNFFQSTVGGFVSGAGSVVKGAGELLSKTSDPSSALTPGGFLNAPQVLSKMLGVDLGKGLQSAGSALQSVPGVITNPAFKDDGEAKAGRFIGGVASLLAGGEVGAAAKAGRAAALIPMLFAGGYADQHDAAQQHFDQQAAAGNPVPPDQAEAIAHRAGIIGGAINAVLGIPLEGAGKTIAGFFGSASPATLAEKFTAAYTQGGALGVSDSLRQFIKVASEKLGTSATEQEIFAAARKGLKGVEDEISKTAGDRALDVAGRMARDASIGAAVQTGQNLTTQTYDPTRGTFQDVPERAAEFGAMGALFGTIDAKRAAGKAAEARAAFGGTPPPDASGNAAVPSGPEAPQGGGGNTGPEGTQNQRHLTQGIDADIASANAAKLKGLGYSDSEIAGMDPAEADRRAKQEIGKPSNVPAGAPTPDDWKNAIQKAGSAADIKNVSELVAGDRVVSKTDGQSGKVTGANARSARIEFDNGTVLTVSRTGTLARESQLQKFLEQAPVESIDEGQAQAATRKLVAGGMQIGDILKLSPQERLRMAFPGGSQETPEAVSQQPSGASAEEQLAKAEAQPSPVEDEESLTAEKAAIERAGAGAPELQARLKTIGEKLANLGASGKAPAETPTKEAPTKGQSGEVPGASPIITQEGEETPSGKAPTIDDAAHEAAASPFSPKPAPSRAQIDANNAKVGKFSVAGIPISIEHPAGSSRNPEKGWPALQEAHYGYLRGVAKSGDSEKMDAFVKTGTPEDYKGPVFVVNRHLAPSGAVDHKVFIGPDSRVDAARIHNLNYPEGLHVSPGDVAQFNSSESFKRWATGNDIVTAPAKGDAMPEGWDKPEPGPSLSAIRKMPDADRAERTAMLEKAKTEAAAAMQEARGKDISTYGAEKEKFEFADQALATMRRATEEKTDEPTKENTSGSKGPAQAGGAGKDIAGNEGNDGKRNKQAAPSSPASSAITPDYAKALGKRLRNGKLKDGFDLAQAKLFDVSRPPNPGKEQEKFDEDVKKTSGLKAVENKETEKLEVHHNAVATADSMRNVEAKMLHAGATPEEARKAADRWFETAMKEETIHLPQLISERGGPDYAKTYTGVWQQVPENVRKLVIALRNRKESDAERGAEFERMVIQFRETGTITEANEADADKERWFRELKPYLELKQNQPLEENISRIMRLIAERTGSKREDGKPWKAEVEDKPEQEEERGPPSSEPEKSNIPSVKSADDLLASLKAKLKAQGQVTDARLESQIADLEKETVSAPSTTTEPAIAEASESSLQTGADRLADWVADKIRAAKKFSLQELYDEADQAFGGTQANNAYSFKDATDAMESGVNRWIRAGRINGPEQTASPEVIIARLKAVMTELPTQGRQRSEEMEQFQQYSTPPPHAYVANWVANIKPGEMMLEPSAGLGGLAVFAKNAGAVVVTNEFSPRRKQMLELLDFDRFFSEDAEQLNNVLPADIKPSVVVMNPPFSQTAGRMGGKRDIMVGARHVEQALKRLQDDGRLVAIVGRGMTLDAPAFKQWWAGIRDKYDVRAVIGISGKEYAKYGTTFDNLIMVIDNSGPTLVPPITGDVDRVEELPELLKEVRNDRHQPTIAKPDRAPFEGPRENVETGLPSGATGGSKPAGVGGSGEQTGRVATETRPGGEHGSGASADEASGSGSNLEPQPVGEIARTGKKPRRGRGNTATGSDEVSGRKDSGSTGGSGVEAEVSAAEKESEDGEDQVFDSYQPSIKVKGSVPNATPLAESSAMASVDSPAAKYAPKINPAIITQGILSDAQLETVVLAGAAHSEKLPSGETKGFFCGDGTGVGKTRQIVGIFLDNWNRGRKKGVWLTMSSSLLGGAKKGMEQLLWNPDLLIQHGKTKMGELIEAKEGILFTSYNTLARETPDPEKGVTKRIDQIVEWLGPNFDGMIAMDEAHQMGNVIATKGARGTTKPSLMAMAGVALQERLPNARVVYFSATGATDVRNLAYATRLGLWGAGTPFTSVRDFVSKIEASGVAAMEMVARDMKGLGLYLSRNISYNGVGYEKLIHELTPDQTGIYDELAGAWQLILNNMAQALELTDQSKNGIAKSAANSKFWGAHQRFFNQVITAMEMPTVVKAIEKSIAAGRAPVVQLVNTNEAQTKSILADKAAEALETGEDTDYDSMDFTPRKSLMDYIERGFPTQQYEEYVDDEGNTRTRPALDSAGKPIHNAEAVKLREALLTRLAEIRVPENPLDMLLDHFGADNVAEVTGRTVRLVKRRDENGAMKKVRESWSKVKGLADANAFQDDKKKLLAFSAAGGTGMDYHADLSRANQRPRDHYVIQSGWRADSAVQGFGRTHRNNQKQPPVYSLVSTNLNAQKRFVSTIARRLDQLGALTKGQRDTGSQGMMSAMDNLENEYAVEALKSFYRDLVRGHVEGVKLEDFEEQTGQKLTDKDGNLSDDAVDIKRFLNRLLNFKVDMMNKVWDAFFERFANIIELARQRGELDTGMETIKAQSAKVVRTELLNTDAASGAKTNYQEVELTHPTKISDFETMKGKAKKGWYKNLKSGQVWAYMADHNHTTKEGSIITEGMLYSHRGNLAGIALPLLHDPKKWETVTEEEAKPLIDEQIAKTPKTYQETAHMITGALLPIWNRLHGSNKVYRVTLDNGKRLLGRRESEETIGPLLENFKIAAGNAGIKPERILETIQSGTPVKFADGTLLMMRRVYGDERIEVSGPKSLSPLAGKFTERIGYEARYFLPTDSAIKAIEQISVNNPPISDMGPALHSAKPGAIPGFDEEGNLTPDEATIESDSDTKFKRTMRSDEEARLKAASDDSLKRILTGHALTMKGRVERGEQANFWTRMQLGIAYKELLSRGVETPKIPALERYIGNTKELRASKPSREAAESPEFYKEMGGRPDPLHAAKPSAFALDAEDQARWMAGEARGRGYSSTGEMLASEPDSFDRMAKQWRAFHARDEAGKLLQEDGIRAINERLYGPEKQAIPGLEEADFGRRIAGSRDALGDAATVVGANAGAGGSSGKGKDRWKQGEALKDWAEKNGLLLDELPTSLDPGSKKNKGGVEHDSFPDETAQRWIKVTRGPGVDMGVFPEPRFDGWELRAGTPTEYLSRLLDSNQVFGDDVRLHAVVQDKDGLRVVTSQPNIVGSEVDGEGQMDAAFESAGFRPIGYATYYRKRDNTAVFDVHAGNAVESDGVVIPFDVVTVHPTGDLLEAIEDTIFKNAVDSSKRQLAATKPGAIPGFDEEGNLAPEELHATKPLSERGYALGGEDAYGKKRVMTFPATDQGYHAWDSTNHPGNARFKKWRFKNGTLNWVQHEPDASDAEDVEHELAENGLRVVRHKDWATGDVIHPGIELHAAKPSRLPPAESPEFYKEMAEEVVENESVQKASEPDPDQMADIIAAFKEEKKHSDWPAIHIADVMERAGYAGPTMYLGKQHLMWMWKNGKIASLVGTDWSLTDDRIHAWGIRQHAGNDGVRGIALAIVDSKLNDLHAAKPAGVTLADVLEKTGVTDVIDIIQAGFSPDDRLTREEREKFAASGDPYAIGNARKTGMILDHIFALIDQRKKQWEEALSDARTMIEKLSPKLKLEIMKRVDEGTPLKAGPFKDAFDKIAAMDAMRVKQAKDWFDAHGQEHWKNYENYLKNIVPHYFKDPEQANKVIDRYIKDRNVAGGTGWMKHRSDLTMREIIEWAATQGIKLEPKHDNVIDAIMDRWMQQERYFGAHELMEKMEKEGAGRWVPSDYTLKSGERQINQIVGIRTVNGPEGRRIAQKFVADAPSAQILNNHLSRGLRSGHKAVEHYFTAANRLNALQLGFSGFHAGFVGIEGMVSTFALGIEKILSGDLSGLKDMAFSPFSTVSDWKLGRKIHAGMLNPGGMGSQMAFVVDSMIQGGFRAGQDSFYKNQDIKAFMDALRGHQIFKGVLRAPWAAIELIAKPIMEYFVPYMKAAAVYKLAEMHLKQSPNITATELHRRLQEDVRSGNNRFGQMTYDNLHLHKTVKDLLMGLTRSLGWNWGTFAELGGGFTDWAKFAKDAAIYGARKIGGGGKKPPGGGDDGGANDDDYAPGGAKFPRVTNKMAYTLALPLLVGLFGAVLSAFFGKKPQTLKDYYFVQTGDIDDHGNPVRVVLPSYMKDLFHAFRHPLSTVTNKLHPLLSMVAQMLENKDFYGIEIRHAGDPVMKQILEELKYVGKEVIPFTGRNASKAQSTALKVAGLVGVTQAPAYASKTAAQELADELNAEKMPTSARTQEQADHSALRSQIIGQERAGQQTGLLAKSEAEGKITPHDASYISRMAGMTRLQASVSHLSIDDAQKVLEKATPDEKREIAPIIAQKKARSAKFMYAGGQ